MPENNPYFPLSCMKSGETFLIFPLPRTGGGVFSMFKMGGVEPNCKNIDLFTPGATGVFMFLSENKQ